MTSPSSAPTNAPPRTVTELSADLKRTVEDTFGFVRVRGEISQPKLAGSGHCYLRLKDENACIDGIVWRGAYAKLAVKPEEGLEVIVTGRLTTYPGRSSYQIIIESMEMAGEGALLKLLEERKRKLAAEGLFAPERKKRLPFLPRVIGVVTSPTGAVIRDILHRLNDRFPMHVLVWPVLVQGEGAAAQVAAAVDGFNRLVPGGPVPRPDLLIVARGGGSLEDLMAFNEEVVVRAVAASAIPVISAVGHETDTTLCDFAADLRAPTPTGAAEMAVPVRLDLLAQVREDGTRLDGAARRMIADRATRLEGLARGIPALDRVVEDYAQRLDERWERLGSCGRAYMDRRAAEVRHLGASLRSPREQIAAKEADLRQASGQLTAALRLAWRDRVATLRGLSDRLRPEPLRADVVRAGTELGRLSGQLDSAFARLVGDGGSRLATAGERLEASSHRAILKRGFAVVRDEAGHVVESRAALHGGQALRLELHDGTAPVVVGEGEATASPPAAAPPVAPAARKRKGGDDRQDSLF